MEKQKNLIQQFLFNLTDNSMYSWFILPLAIYNYLSSKTATNKQFNILKSVINDNDKFADALHTLGFLPNEKQKKLTAIYEVDLEMSDDEMYKTANQQIILAVKNFLVDELLLGIVKIEIKKLPGYKLQVDLQPAEKNLNLLDGMNLLYSCIFTFLLATVCFSIYYLFNM